MTPGAALTPRQRQVLATVVRLDSRKCAAAELGISVSTLRGHLTACRLKLGAATTMQAAVLAVASGEIPAGAMVRAA